MRETTSCIYYLLDITIRLATIVKPLLCFLCKFTNVTLHIYPIVIFVLFFLCRLLSGLMNELVRFALINVNINRYSWLRQRFAVASAAYLTRRVSSPAVVSFFFLFFFFGVVVLFCASQWVGVSLIAVYMFRRHFEYWICRFSSKRLTPKIAHIFAFISSFSFVLFTRTIPISSQNNSNNWIP